VISSLESLQNDVDYQYLRNYQERDHKPMTAKDRARHGMLRMMLRKQLEVTRPNWPKHPNFRATDRNLDVELEVRRENRRLAKSQSSPTIKCNPMFPSPTKMTRNSRNSPKTSPAVDPFASFDLAKIASKPTIAMSPDFLKTFNLSMSLASASGNFPETTTSPPGGVTRRHRNMDTLRGMNNMVGSFGVEAEGRPAPLSAIDKNLFYGKTNRLPSPSARNLELMKQKEYEKSLKVYARPATTEFRVNYLGEGGNRESRGLYQGSKRNVVKIQRGVRIARVPDKVM